MVSVRELGPCLAIPLLFLYYTEIPVTMVSVRELGPCLVLSPYCFFITQRFLLLWRPSEDWGPAWETREMRRAWMTLPDYMVSEREEVTSGKGKVNGGYRQQPDTEPSNSEENSDATANSTEVRFRLVT